MPCRGTTSCPLSRPRQHFTPEGSWLSPHWGVYGAGPLWLSRGTSPSAHHPNNGCAVPSAYAMIPGQASNRTCSGTGSVGNCPSATIACISNHKEKKSRRDVAEIAPRDPGAGHLGEATWRAVGAGAGRARYPHPAALAHSAGLAHLWGGRRGRRGFWRRDRRRLRSGRQ